MFENGFFPFASQLQGSAGRTWNYVSQFAKLVWFKFNHLRPSAVMPRSRRRHHSRSRSRSRSHSHDRDRDAKRRKIETNDESPPNRKSISSDHEDEANSGGSIMEVEIQNDAVVECSESIKDEPNNPSEQNVQAAEKDEKVSAESVVLLPSDDDSREKPDVTADLPENGGNNSANDTTRMEGAKDIVDKVSTEIMDLSSDESTENDSKEKVDNVPKSSDYSSSSKDSPSSRKIIKTLETSVTPTKPLTPKQLRKKQESEKKRLEQLKQREEREKQRQEERERLKLEKLKIKQEEKEKRNKELQEKLEQKQKEKELKEEQKRKEKEEKEQKRKEKEQREEQKRKEKENERLKKLQELEEKNKEKQKQEEQRQKTSAAFKNFFVMKKSDDDKQRTNENDTQKKGLFKSFEIKSDMRLAPLRREPLSEIQKNELIQSINSSESTYLKDIKSEKTGKCGKTWPFEEESDNEVVVIEDEKDLGEALCEEQIKPTKMRAKFLKFHENRRPAYFGTWRKVNKLITARRPFSRDTDLLNYEEDSDDDWEEEEQGESLDDSDGDGDDKEEATNDDYEVDNDFFVPHGHLSDDEVDDEATAKMSPESHKQKLKLLKDEFDLDMKSKTNKIKPRFIGCIWYKKDGKNVDEVIDRYLQPFAMIMNGVITIKKRNKVSSNELPKPEGNVENLDSKLIPEFIKLVHRNISNRKTLVADFIAYMNKNGYDVNISKAGLSRNIKRVATWIRCPESGSMFNKFCWYVPEDIRKKYAVELCQSKSE